MMRRRMGVPGWLCTASMLALLGCVGDTPNVSRTPSEEHLDADEQPSVRWELCLPGLRRVRDIRPGTDGSTPVELVHGDGVLVFAADDGEHGREPWTSTGERRRTMPVRDIRPGAEGSEPSDFTQVGARVFFVADDGTSGRELWVTDGTVAGTRLVSDLRAGAEGSAPEDLTPFDGVLYFMADDGVNGRELWRSDGTADGTSLLRDFSPPGSDTYSVDMVAGEDFLYITVYAGANIEERVQLWKTDGTPGGFVRILAEYEDTGISSMTPVGDRLFFLFNFDREEYDLFVVDADGSLHFLREFPGRPHDLVAFMGRLYFASGGGTVPDSLGDELWRSDGTPEGTVRVRDVLPGPGDSGPRELAVLGAHLFFSADDGAHGRELWRSNGTSEGTVLLEDFEPGPVGSAPEELVAIQGRLFMSVETSGRGREPWAHDGDTDGATPLPEVAPGPASSDPRGFVRSGWDVFFSADDGASGREPWAQRYRPPGRCAPTAP